MPELKTWPPPRPRPSACPPDCGCHADCLVECLDRYVPTLESRLRHRFPPSVAQEAAEKAGMAAIDLIGTGVASRMSSIARRERLLVVAVRDAIDITRRRRHLSLSWDTDRDNKITRTRDWQRIDALQAALDSLPRDLRDPVKAVYFDDLSRADAARLLGVPLYRLCRRLRIALQALRWGVTERLENLEWIP